jgi:hypothetical protein
MKEEAPLDLEGLFNATIYTFLLKLKRIPFAPR